MYNIRQVCALHADIIPLPLHGLYRQPCILYVHTTARLTCLGEHVGQWMNCLWLPSPSGKSDKTLHLMYLQPHYSSRNGEFVLRVDDSSRYTLVWLWSVLWSIMYISPGWPTDNHPHYVESVAALFPTLIFILHLAVSNIDSSPLTSYG